MFNTLHRDLKLDEAPTTPPGYEAGTDKVLLLLHSLYGLKQCGRAWYHKFTEVLLKHGFEQVPVEHCLYFRCQNRQLQIISAWVDNLLLLEPDPDSTSKMKKVLRTEFEVHDLGEPQYLIGM